MDQSQGCYLATWGVGVAGWMWRVGLGERLWSGEEKFGEGSYLWVVQSSFWDAFCSFKMYFFLCSYTGICCSLRGQKKDPHSFPEMPSRKWPQGQQAALNGSLWPKGEMVSFLHDLG